MKIKNLIKNILVVMFTLSMVFLYAFTTNQASAAVGSQEVEKTLNYLCEAYVPIPGAEPGYSEIDFKFSAKFPERVQPGEEFDLTDVSLIMDFPDLDNPSDEPQIATLESPNFKINSENSANMAHTFLDDYEIVIPPWHVGGLVMQLTSEDGETVGPFIAGDEGEVILKADEIRMNQVMDIGVVVSIGLACLPTDDDEAILGTVTIDSESPVITLNGDSTMVVKQGDPYEEPGATAQDNVDGDLSDEIDISGDVDTDTIGTYTVAYTVSDSVGNETTVERIVEVVEPFGSWLTGEGAPSDEIGSNGDSYLDTTTGDIHKRDPSTWTKIGNLKGDDGKQGSSILIGSGAPSADAGNVGALYLNTKTGDVYEKTADGWKNIANLQGTEGPQGPKGSGGGSDTGDGDDGKQPSGKKKVTAKSDGEDKDSTTNGGKLPKTATSLPTLMLIGTLLATAGGVLFLRRRKAIE